MRRADLHLSSLFDEIALHVTECNLLSCSRRVGHAGDAADFSVAGVNPVILIHTPARDRQADESLRDPASTTVQNANDDFLPYVTAFAHADRGALDACLEGDRRIVH